jgi:hypothetical protein
MLNYYQFTPKKKWNEVSTIPNIREYKPISLSMLDQSIQNNNAYVTKNRGWDMTKPTLFIIAKGNVLFGYGNTYEKSNESSQIRGVESVESSVFRGPNEWAGEEWHIFENGWATFNVLGSGRPIVESYLGKFEQIENPYS